MEESTATVKKEMLQELQEINRIVASSNMSLSILPILVRKEVLGVKGESTVPIEFELSTAEATQKFKETLKFELEQLTKSNVQFPFTYQFIQKVMKHAEVYQAKQYLRENIVFGPPYIETVEMDYKTARQVRHALSLELNKLLEKGPDDFIIVKLLKKEYRFIDNYVGLLASNKTSDKLPIPKEDSDMLSHIPVSFGLLCGEDINRFISKLRTERIWLKKMSETFPLAIRLTDRVIKHAERYKVEKTRFTVPSFGSD